jgi:hypothetical protein
VVGEADLKRYARTAEAAGLSMSEWARQALRAAERESTSGDTDTKLAVIRKAVGHQAGGREVDIDTMLAETEAGYLVDIDDGLADAR